jgi:AcrR family transcriptional regulator
MLRVFGFPMARRSSTKPLPSPHKRPKQARSQFTLQALYDAFVRIWRRGGWGAVSMRSLAAEAGYAVGTLYEYFPNREAMLSGYYRYCLDSLSERLRELDAAAGAGTPWPARLRGLVSVTFDEARKAPYFDAEMLLLESTIADAAQHRKAFARLCDTWQALLASWPDLPALDRNTIELLVTTLWGARRYGIILGQRRATASDVDRATAMLVALLAP